MTYETLEEAVMVTLDAVRPPERLTVAEAQEKYRHLRNPGAYTGPWQNFQAPYLVEPCSVFTDLNYKGGVLVGPSQCGKTELYLGWHLHTVICDPSDLMLLETSQDKASDFSARRIGRMHRDSPEVGKRLLPGSHNDNVTRKRYSNGSLITLGWPSITQLSGKPIPRLFLTDYDRMTLDVEGEGSPYDLARARTTTFGRHAMCFAESSPSHPVLDSNWASGSPHEAPPCEGILSLYNRGDRRRWHWICVVCGLSFEPDFSLLKWEDNPRFMQAAESVRMYCPHCNTMYGHDNSDSLPGKYEMNLRGFWLKDGQTRRRDGEIIGEPYQSEIASFWLKGVAAAFKDWKTIVKNYLDAEQEYHRTGSESSLKTTTNTDRAEPYTPKSELSERAPQKLQDRAIDLGYKVVPPQVVFLVAAVDIQKTRFVVQVTGVSPGGDLWIVDRFDIKISLRPDKDKEGQMHYVRPFTYAGDWRLLMREVMLRTYELNDGSGRHMAIKVTISDSGGMSEATSNAYQFYRWLKAGPSKNDPDFDEWTDWMPHLDSRFQLYKGMSTLSVPRVKINHPDSGRQSKFAGARGEVPVLQVNVTTVKNYLDSILDRDNPKSGRVNFPKWLKSDFYKELCVETKSPKGVWENPRNFHNESWDLMVMTLAVLLERRHVGIETIDWDRPPAWAQPWDANALVFYPADDEPSPLASRKASKYSPAELGRLLG